VGFANFSSEHPAPPGRRAQTQKAIAQSEIAPTAPSLSGKRFDATEDRD
jgi:hypothetical protein